MLWVLNHPTPKQRNDLHVIIRDDFKLTVPICSDTYKDPMVHIFQGARVTVKDSAVRDYVADVILDRRT